MPSVDSKPFNKQITKLRAESIKDLADLDRISSDETTFDAIQIQIGEAFSTSESKESSLFSGSTSFVPCLTLTRQHQLV